MTDSALNQIVVEAIEDVKGIDVITLDVREMTSVVDFMLIATGTSTRQVKALADMVVKKAKEAGFTPLSSEGRESAEWVLIDFGDLCVHLMQAETRKLYDLERLWTRLPTQSTSLD